MHAPRHEHSTADTRFLRGDAGARENEGPESPSCMDVRSLRAASFVRCVQLRADTRFMRRDTGAMGAACDQVRWGLYAGATENGLRCMVRSGRERPRLLLDASDASTRDTLHSPRLELSADRGERVPLLLVLAPSLPASASGSPADEDDDDAAAATAASTSAGAANAAEP
jgi:hypothetical protein